MKDNLLLKNNGSIQFDDIFVKDIIKKTGTPVYVYSARGIVNTTNYFKSAINIDKDIAYKYAVKANTNLEIIKLINENGFGTDVVSGGELIASLKAGVNPKDIVFAGVGKTVEEIKLAFEKNIGYISTESDWEIERIREICKLFNTSTKLLVRTNLNVDSSTHPYLTTGREENKFGIDSALVLKKYKEWQNTLSIPIDGVQIHIGSQITDVAPFEEAANSTIQFVDELRKGGAVVKIVDFGGGVGIPYSNNEIINIKAYGKIIRSMQKKLNVRIILEPGRFLVANNGILLGSTIYFKYGVKKNFLVTDIAMNDLIRPALYKAYHQILTGFEGDRKISDKPVDVVGPICESGDYISLNQKSFPILKPDDYIAVKSAGAYGFVMASNYNMRPKPAEVLIKENEIIIIRKRQNVSGLI